jgi:hypothetical protein
MAQNAMLYRLVTLKLKARRAHKQGFSPFR